MIDLVGLDNTAPINISDPVNSRHPLNQGRIGWWLCLPGLTGGSRFYDLCGLNHGTLTTMTAAGRGWNTVFPRPGGWSSISFTGNNDYIECGNSSKFNFTTENFSVSFWFYPTAGGRVPLGRGTYATEGWYIYSTAGGQLQLEMDRPGVSNALSSPNGATNSYAWNHVTIIRTGTTTGTMYINGNAVATTGTTGDCATSTLNLRIGFYSAAGNGVIGYMDDVSIWNRALSASEARANYESSISFHPGVLNRVSKTQAQIAGAAALTASGALFRPQNYNGGFLGYGNL